MLLLLIVPFRDDLSTVDDDGVVSVGRLMYVS